MSKQLNLHNRKTKRKSKAFLIGLITITIWCQYDQVLTQYNKETSTSKRGLNGGKLSNVLDREVNCVVNYTPAIFSSSKDSTDVIK